MVSIHRVAISSLGNNLANETPQQSLGLFICNRWKIVEELSERMPFFDIIEQCFGTDTCASENGDTSQYRCHGQLGLMELT